MWIILILDNVSIEMLDQFFLSGVQPYSFVIGDQTKVFSITHYSPVLETAGSDLRKGPASAVP